VNINTNFSPMGGGNWMAGGLSGRSLMVRSSSSGIQGANNASTHPAFREALMDIRGTADTLRTAMRDAMGFGSDPHTPFGSLHAVSGNTEVMAILNSNNRMNRAGDFEVEVLQIATAQRNEGTARNVNARAVDSGFVQGNNQLNITVGSQTFNFNVHVSASDTVQTVHQRFADAINVRNSVGVTASVAREGTGNAQTSALVLQFQETGVRNEGQPNFTVSGNAANALGVTTVTQQAQDAQFRVNRDGRTGALQTSRSNELDLGFGTTAQIRAAGTAGITMARDEVGQINALRNMVNLFNDLVEVAQANRAGQNGGRLERELRSMINSSTSALARVGINMNQHGFLDINEERMREAAASGALEEFAQPGGVRSNAGFFNRVERMADRVGRNAASYVGANAANPMANFDMTQMSANWNNQFNNWMNAGMLFDSMF